MRAGGVYEKRLSWSAGRFSDTSFTVGIRVPRVKTARVIFKRVGAGGGQDGAYEFHGVELELWLGYAS